MSRRANMWLRAAPAFRSRTWTIVRGSGFAFRWTSAFAITMLAVMQHAAVLLTLGAVARRLNLSETRVRQLDATLSPVRDSTNRRLYQPEVVERIAAERAARRSA